MVSWGKALTKTRRVFGSAFGKVLRTAKRGVDDQAIEELEEALLAADVSPSLTGELIGQIEKNYKGLDLSHTEVLKEILVRSLGEDRELAFEVPGDAPTCILVVGVNGSGKTTTCAKLAHRSAGQGRKTLLCAADTFRAAGTEQLRLWADRINCDIVAGNQGSDAAAVSYDALDAATARGMEYLFIDTAGRMHTRQPLMEELQKTVRALQKRNPAAPHETWMVLDASIGQNALVQARVFNEMVPLTGVVITKLDGSSKAGFLFSVRRELDVPILFTGLGEGEEDLVPFRASEFVDGLLELSSEVDGDEAAGR